jgi:hypothetical protein
MAFFIVTAVKISNLTCFFFWLLLMDVVLLKSVYVVAVKVIPEMIAVVLWQVFCNTYVHIER